jgi:hypothetical protein
MADNRTDTHHRSLPVANYSPAIAKAVDWLGNRYLLAQPINASRKHQAAIKHQAPVPPARRTFNPQ